MTRPSPGDVRRAAAALPPEIRDTPCVRSPWLSAIAGHDVWIKLESLQPTHSFKVRGAFLAVAAMERGDTRALVTASAGNHGAALAWAAARAGRPLTVFTPAMAPAAKLQRIAALGADLRAVAADYDDAEARAREHAAAHGARFVSPYNDPLVIAGAGTVGAEILGECAAVDEIVVPVGGGGLLSGIALSRLEGRRGVRVVGVETEASTAFTAALAEGRITPVAVGDTLADGLAGNLERDSITFPLVQRFADGVLVVPERAVRRAIPDLLREEHLVAEGAAAVAIAAVAEGRTSPDARCTVIVLSGSNIDDRRLASLVLEHSDAQGPTG